MMNNNNVPQIIDQEQVIKKQWIVPEMITLDITLDSGANMDGNGMENS